MTDGVPGPGQDPYVLNADNSLARSRAKIRYAQLLLGEIKDRKAFGDDFDYAHEEGCLAHLDGAVDAFLQQVNACHRLDIKLWEVSLRSVRAALSARKIDCPEFKELSAALDDPASWLSVSREFRNHQTHRSGVARNYVIVVGESSWVELRNPRTGTSERVDRCALIQRWIDQSQQFFERLSQSLRGSYGLPRG